MGISGGPYIVRDSSLVLELDASDKNSYLGSGTSWYDLSSNFRIGTLVNSPTFDSSNFGSINFPSANSYISLPSINMAGSVMSFTAFVKVNIFGVTNSTNTIVRKGDANPNDYTFCVRDSKVAFGAENADDSTTPTGSTTLSSGVWYHLASSWNGTTVTFYVNGNNDGSTPLNVTIVDDGKPTYVGGRLLAADGLSGSIANVQMYNRALTANEVIQNYNELKSRFNL